MTESRSSRSSSPSHKTDYNVADAALHGASLAFKKPAPTPKPKVNTYSGTNGAFAAAAATVGRSESNASTPRRLSNSSASSTDVEARSLQRLRELYSPQSQAHLLPPQHSGPVRTRSPSNIAASLAVARHPLIRRSVTGSKALDRSDSPPRREARETDTSSIPSTISLVKMFEQTDTPASPSPRPKPKPKLAPKPKPKPDLASLVDPIKSPVAPVAARSPPSQLASSSGSRPVSRAKRLSPTSPEPDAYTSAPESPLEKPKPALPPPRRKAKPTDTKEGPPVRGRSHSQPSRPEPTASFLTLPHLRRPSVSPGGPYSDRSLQQISPHITGETLANAIVGAHLASKRTMSPPSKKPAPALPPKRRQNHHHHPNIWSRNTSPEKPAPQPGHLRTTMRGDPSSSDSEDGRQKKGHRHKLVRKHPNKHHEGTRKRWRDKVTERERKRYEGVWAANRGLHLGDYSPEEQDEVASIVVRDLWSRSRLPAQTLEEVWDLVDNRGIGQLTREEFVVGMWLVDQRLKGRKLPVKVSESIWDSVRAQGIKIRRMKGS